MILRNVITTYTRRNSNRRHKKYLLLVLTFEFNIRSLMNKIDDLQQTLSTFFSVMRINVKWLDNNTESLVQLANYSFNNINRTTNTGGGVAMFISSSINYLTRCQ